MVDYPQIPDLSPELALEELGLTGARLELSETSATDTRVWRVSYNGHSLAIRVLREAQQGTFEHERAAMTRALSHGIPVPEILRTGIIEDRFPAMAIKWLEGEPLGEALLGNRLLARRLGYASGKLLARIHAIPEMPDLGRDAWIERGATGNPELQEMLSRVATTNRSLLHLDYHPFNLMTSNGAIVGVLDWSNGTYGDPRADVARTISMMQLVAPALVSRRGARRMSIGLFTRGFRDGYTTTHGPLTGMAPFYAWAGNMIQADLLPKLDALPIANKKAFRHHVERWTARWRGCAVNSQPD